MQYKGSKRVSMMGIVHLEFPVMEKYRFKKTRYEEALTGLSEAKEPDSVSSLSEKSLSQFSKLSDQNKTKFEEGLSDSANLTPGIIQKMAQGLKKTNDRYLETLAYIQTSDFWATYYRHNNYFYEKNSTIF